MSAKQCVTARELERRFQAAKYEALKAEARAWRRAAEGYTDERALFKYLAPFGALCHATPYTPVAVAAQRRQEAHRALSPFFDFADIEACVWCCLFLALECEDEAQEAAGG